MFKDKIAFSIFKKKKRNHIQEQKQENSFNTNTELQKEIDEFSINVNNIQGNVEALSNEVMDIAYSINEISKETAEAAQLTDSMNQTSCEIGASIEGVSAKAKDAAVASEKIADRAEKMMISSVDANEKANIIYKDTREQLKKAIEKAKRVDEIRSLSEEIRYIAENTNLISLNAAIEAARVGEAGRSFAVVASTIRELSDSTKKTVEKIQSVADSVVEVVGFLSDSSEKLLKFVNDQVINDYATMVGTAKQYKEDASLYNDIAKELGVTSEEMSLNVQKMVTSIDTISKFNRSFSNKIEETAVTVANSSIHSMEVLGDMESIANGSKRLVSILDNSNKENQ